MNDRYAIRALRIERPQHNGERRNRPEFSFEPSNFKYYLMINDAIDKPILKQGATVTTIRDRHLAQYANFEWSNLESVPIHMQFATVTAVVTVERQLVVAIRSEMQAITDGQEGKPKRWPASMSCAEGMLRPVDTIAKLSYEEPSPFLTGIRALRDELGLYSGKHILESDLRLLGLGFDTKRFQPVAVFLIELSRLKFKDVYECWQTAKDRHENLTLIPISITSHDLAELLRGKKTYESRPVNLFSNH